MLGGTVYLLAGVDHDPVTTGKKRFHRIAVDRDHAQIGGTGPELVEQPKKAKWTLSDC